MADIGKILDDILTSSKIDISETSEKETMILGAFFFGILGEYSTTERFNSTEGKKIFFQFLKNKLKFKDEYLEPFFSEYVLSSKPERTPVLFNIIEDGRKAYIRYTNNDTLYLADKVNFILRFANMIKIPDKTEMPRINFEKLNTEYPLDTVTIDHFAKIFTLLKKDFETLTKDVGGMILPTKSVSDYCQLMFYKSVGMEFTIMKRPSHKISIQFIEKYAVKAFETLQEHLKVFGRYAIVQGVPADQMAIYFIQLYYESVHKKLFPTLEFEMYDK